MGGEQGWVEEVRSLIVANQHRLSVLIVEQDEEAQLQLKGIMAGQDYGVTCISEPLRAPEEVRQNRYQLIFLDVSPESAGAEALAAIRDVDTDICVIATTGVASVEAAVATMKHQAFHYLQKPLCEEEVLAVVEEAIRDRGLLVDLETHLNSEVGRRIRTQRHESELTLKQLANRTGLSVSLISQIELGKSAASMSTIHKLAAALGVKITYFFETL
ncbi:MAG: response regulator [Myxococcales bacterium]|nr:response regulator [Myxococcales bacterium]HIK83629.1 response regulator [Myxococcales bacterium]